MIGSQPGLIRACARQSARWTLLRRKIRRNGTDWQAQSTFFLRSGFESGGIL